MQSVNEPFIVVVGVDYSDTSALALERALELASTLPHTELHAVNVVHPLTQADAFMYFSSSLPTLSIGQAEADLKSYVGERIAAFHAEHGSKVRDPERVRCHLRLAAPAHEIAQLASDLEADLIVVGTHGRRGLKRVLVGSVAEGVARLAPCPVLVVRPKQVVEMERILPPCPDCVKVRQATQGAENWCEAHRAYHGQRRHEAPAASELPRS
jgi:nucleotide-binding universal stress UspA family protein